MPHVGEPGIRVKDTAPLGTVPVAESENLALTANLEKVREEMTSARSHSEKFRAAGEPIAKEHQAASTKVREK